MNTAPRLLWITPPEGDLSSMCDALKKLHDVPDLFVLLRRPTATTRRLLAEGRALTAAGAALLVSARVDVALTLGARGVHLPERGMSVCDARVLVGTDALVGVSRHDREGLLAAMGADYATLSPFLAVDGKGEPLGPSGFTAQRNDVALPVLALGGVTPENADVALRAGAYGLAFIRAGLDDGASAIRALHRQMG